MKKRKLKSILNTLCLKESFFSRALALNLDGIDVAWDDEDAIGVDLVKEGVFVRSQVWREVADRPLDLSWLEDEFTPDQVAWATGFAQVWYSVPTDRALEGAVRNQEEVRLKARIRFHPDGPEATQAVADLIALAFG